MKLQKEKAYCIFKNVDSMTNAKKRKQSRCFEHLEEKVYMIYEAKKLVIITLLNSSALLAEGE